MTEYTGTTAAPITPADLDGEREAMRRRLSPPADPAVEVADAVMNDMQRFAASGYTAIEYDSLDRPEEVAAVLAAAAACGLTAYGSETIQPRTYRATYLRPDDQAAATAAPAVPPLYPVTPDPDVLDVVALDVVDLAEIRRLFRAAGADGATVPVMWECCAVIPRLVEEIATYRRLLANPPGNARADLVDQVFTAAAAAFESIATSAHSALSQALAQPGLTFRTVPLGGPQCNPDDRPAPADTATTP